MKKATLFVFALLCTTLGMAQQYQMHVKLNNGTVVDYDVANVESVTWSEKTSEGQGTHEYVDLGLSVKWATCNVGANSPEEYGDYFAWGETEPKGEYNWSTYKYCNGSRDTMTKYCTYSSYGTVDNKETLEPEDDVAHVKWGGDWRMPTRAEQDELRHNCTWTWASRYGVNGYIVKGPNGNSIFLPAAGWRYNSSLICSGLDGSYWSSSLYALDSYCAFDIYFDSSRVYAPYGSRYDGKPVRAVCP